MRCENKQLWNARQGRPGAGTCAVPQGMLVVSALGDDIYKLSKICSRPPWVHYSALSFPYSPGPHFYVISSLFFLFSFLLPAPLPLPPFLFNFLQVPSSLPPPFLRPEVSLCIPVLARLWPTHTGSCSPSALFLSEAASFSSLGLQGCDLTWVGADVRCIGHLGGSAPPTRLFLDTDR